MPNTYSITQNNWDALNTQLQNAGAGDVFNLRVNIDVKGTWRPVTHGNLTINSSSYTDPDTNEVRNYSIGTDFYKLTRPLFGMWTPTNINAPTIPINGIPLDPNGAKAVNTAPDPNDNGTTTTYTPSPTQITNLIINDLHVYSDIYAYSSNPDYVNLVIKSGSTEVRRVYASQSMGCFVTWAVDCKFTNCVSHGSVTFFGSNLGGIAGISENSTFMNCTNQATLLGYQQLGGICGWMISGNIQQCFNTASGFLQGLGSYDINGKASSSFVNDSGGIVGQYDHGDVLDNVNEGNLVLGKGSGHAGGIAGHMGTTYSYYASVPMRVTGNVNKADLAGGDYIGGICGYIAASNCAIDILENRAASNIRGDAQYVGGVVGYITSINGPVTIERNRNCAETVEIGTGNGSYSGQYAGGIVGYISQATGNTYRISIDNNHAGILLVGAGNTGVNRIIGGVSATGSTTYLINNIHDNTAVPDMKLYGGGHGSGTTLNITKAQETGSTTNRFNGYNSSCTAPTWTMNRCGLCIEALDCSAKTNANDCGAYRETDDERAELESLKMLGMTISSQTPDGTDSMYH
ncbi:hypothetical protein AGMMS49992_05280 [Clostridia bacterium]|nr:hypothetical protein AGMMS49992_05280 [Clostridia bacterium]